jgi:hypothetical protein
MVAHLAFGLIGLPFALDGESAGSSSTGLAVISLVSMVSGYVLIACLWHFVFRDKARARRKKDSSEH